MWHDSVSIGAGREPAVARYKYQKLGKKMLWQDLKGQ
jgi:hypothetical protein